MNMGGADAQRLSALHGGGGGGGEVQKGENVLDAMQAGNLNSIQNWLAAVKRSEGLVHAVRGGDPREIAGWEQQTGGDFSESIDPVGFRVLRTGEKVYGRCVLQRARPDPHSYSTAHARTTGIQRLEVDPPCVRRGRGASRHGAARGCGRRAVGGGQR